MIGEGCQRVLLVNFAGVGFISAVLSFKADPWIDQNISDITDKFQQQADQSENIQGAENHRIVPLHHGFKAQQAKTVQRENDFNQQ